MKINFLNPLKCPDCGSESTFGAEIKDLKHLSGMGCNVCWLADWYKHEPPSSHCQRCNSELNWTGNMMMTPEVRDMVDRNTLCINHKNFVETIH